MEGLCTHTHAIANIRIPSHKLYKLFGPGSYNLQSLQDATGVKAEMINGNMLSVVAQTKEDMAKFREIVDNIVGDVREPLFMMAVIIIIIAEL